MGWCLCACLSTACGSNRAADRATAGAGGHVPCNDCAQGGTAASSEAGEGGEPAGGPAASDAGDGGAGDAGAPSVVADGVAISEISFWQALRVPLELEGTAVAQLNAPVILNKGGILRVFVAPDARFEARQLSAVLEVGPSGVVTPVTSKKLIRVASSNDDFTTTFNFPLEREQVVAGASYSITLRDEAQGEIFDRYPRTGREALGATSISPSNTLQIVVVPIIVNQLTPDVSAATLERFRSRVRSMYPLADVTITTHAPVTSTLKVGPEKGWDELLDSVYALRAQEAPAANVFYYGLFTPTARFDDYCVSACTVGYSIVATTHSVEDRGSLGLGIFSDGSNSDAPDTMAHELGHALGREHAPCDTDDAGPFPYPGGKIGSWGFDPLSHKLLDPKIYGDVMGYCSPDWVSDYTYRALFQRLQSVNAEIVAKSLPIVQLAFRRVLLGADGSLRWGSRFAVSTALEGETREVTLLGIDSAAVATVTAHVRNYGDARGGVLVLPESALAAPVAGIRVGNATLALPTH